METKMLHKAILMTKSHKKLSMEYYQDKILIKKSDFTWIGSQV